MTRLNAQTLRRSGADAAVPIEFASDSWRLTLGEMARLRVLIAQLGAGQQLLARLDALAAEFEFEVLSACPEHVVDQLKRILALAADLADEEGLPCAGLVLDALYGLAAAGQKAKDENPFECGWV